MPPHNTGVTKNWSCSKGVAVERNVTFVVIPKILIPEYEIGLVQFKGNNFDWLDT